MINIDVNKVSEIILECMEAVIMPRYQNLQDGDVEEKNPNDFVTVADKLSEEFLTKKLQELLPESVVVGEESVAADKSVLNRIKEDKPCWIIDPIDGTRHFIEGDRRWGVLVALSVNDETQYGWIYDAIEKRMITVKKGEGVFANGERVEYNPVIADDIVDIRLCSSRRIRGKERFKEALSKFKSSTKAYCSVEFFSDFILSKNIDVLAGLGRGINSWDNAAGFLAAEELGAYIRVEENDVYKPSMGDRRFWVLAPNKDMWKKTHDILWPIALEDIKKDQSR